MILVIRDHNNVVIDLKRIERRLRDSATCARASTLNVGLLFFFILLYLADLRLDFESVWFFLNGRRPRILFLSEFELLILDKKAKTF